MMTSNTKRLLDAAVDELKRDGYMLLMVMFDKKEQPCICSGIIRRDDCKAHMGGSIEVLCSETNDPNLLAAMAKDALAEIASPLEFPKPDGNIVIN